MPRVNVKGVSNPIDFPDDMDIEDIKSFLQKRFAGMAARGESTADVSPRQATAQAVNPSLGDKFSQGISDTLYDSGIVSDRYGAQRIGDNLGMIGEVLPGIGDATAGDEFGSALASGDGVGMALGALGAIPLVGDAAKKIPAPSVGFLNNMGELVSQLGREPSGNLAGLPTSAPGFSPRHNKKIASTAQRYMDNMGLQYSPSTEYAKINKSNSKSIADEFEIMKHDPQNPEVKEAYDEMIKEVKIQYQAALDDGLKVDFIDFKRHGDPYAKSPRMANDDIEKNNHMYTFSTMDGFGSSDTFDPTDNPLLQETEFMINGRPALANDLFRVVHDYFGHAKEGLGFRASGEENAWRAHASMFSPKARRAMTTETRGQNSWVNYGPEGDRNRGASSSDTIFADQKIGLLPEWVSDGLPAPSANSNPIKLVDSKTFSEAVEKGRVGNKNAPSLTKYNQKDYNSMRTFLTNDGSAGYAIKDDGDLVSVFKGPNSKMTNALGTIVPDAIRNGAKKLDAFDGFLTKQYQKHGFTEVGRDKWDASYKPKGWTPLMGTPDVVYMKLK